MDKYIVKYNYSSIAMDKYIVKYNYSSIAIN